MHIAQVVAHAERIVKSRIESTVLADVTQNEEVAALPTDAQQQILKIVHERVEPRTIAQTRRQDTMPTGHDRGCTMDADEPEPPMRNSDGTEPLGAWQKWLDDGEAEVVRPGEIRLRDEHLDGDPEFTAGMTWQELSWSAVVVVDQAGGCDPERSQVGRVRTAWDSDYLTELVTIPGKHRTRFDVTTPDGEHAYIGFVTVDTTRVDIGAVRAQLRGWTANLSPVQSIGVAVPAGGWVVIFPDRPDWNDVPVRGQSIGG